jgi:NAD(P)-dependent dehydrogenase (short-subunit alcohol dehydrogenase family)
MAQGLAGAGADLVIVDLNEEAANARAAKIREAGRNSIACRADVTKKGRSRSALEQHADEFGRVDILLNAAGINSGTPFFEIRRPSGRGSWTSICAACFWRARFLGR